MAGICGIISKNKAFEKSGLDKAFEKMLLKLSTRSDQKTVRYANDSIFLGKSFPLSHKQDQEANFNSEFSVYIVFEGLIYIDDSVKVLVQDENRSSTFLSPIDYIPYLYAKYSTSFVNHLTGGFNIFLYDINKQQALLINDRIGFLPMFTYESEDQFVFASKIESILASGLLKSIDFDYVTLAEQVIFNYPLSNHSLIKNITTLPAASIYQVGSKGAKINLYWSPRELFVNQPLSKEKGFEFINEALGVAVNKVFLNHRGDIAVTLTGGWDGRLVLSYALKYFRERVHAFSFGSDNSPDIQIPQLIARNEGFKYTPYILNQEYFNSSFSKLASETIICSNGVRGLRRTHYLFAIPQLTGFSDLILSGSFGDEMLKFSALRGSEVQSEALINYIQSDFTIRPELPIYLFSSELINSTMISELTEEWNNRFKQLEEEVAGYSSISLKYNHIKLSRIANRFFGYEANSYNDYMCNFSPFLDFDFIEAFSKTIYSGIYHPFNTNKLRDKEMIAALYAKLINKNSPKLALYSSDRGYSMNQVLNPMGKILILAKTQFARRKKSANHYFLDKAEDIFEAHINSNMPETCKEYFLQGFSNMNPNIGSRVLSLNYWLGYITKEYK